jgi:hypothetical protein
MILALSLPRFGDQMQEASIHRLLVKAGDALRPGTPLVEVRVDLGASKAQDCPPVMYFRIIATERGFLRTLDAVSGQVMAAGASLGVATTTAAEEFAGVSARPLRTTSLAIQVDPFAR